jgi:hypothetical protein
MVVRVVLPDFLPGPFGSGGGGISDFSTSKRVKSDYYAFFNVKTP